MCLDFNDNNGNNNDNNGNNNDNNNDNNSDNNMIVTMNQWYQQVTRKLIINHLWYLIISFYYKFLRKRGVRKKEAYIK